MPTPFALPVGATYEWPVGESLKRRYWSYVDADDGENACWPWLAFCNPSGYGMVRNGTRMALAHRVAWALTHGQVPVGKQVLHHCDNARCCNPAHLYIGTNDDNVADRVRRDRSAKEQPRRSGELHPLAKLTQAQVDEIRARSTGARGEGRKFAKEYGVSPATICRLLQGRIW